MTSDRPYRKAFSKEKAMAELKRCVGTQFDPEIVRIFIGILNENISSGKIENDALSEQERINIKGWEKNEM